LTAERRKLDGGERIVEVKRRLDGSEQRFDCELVHRTQWWVAVLFRVRGPWGDVPATALDSYGLFWRRRPYNCYYMVRPGESEALVTRFDVVREVELDVPGEVRYLDLLLDLRVDAGVARWEDEDDVSEAAGAGLLNPADLARIARARHVLERGHARVAAEVRSLLRSLGRLPG